MTRKDLATPHVELRTEDSRSKLGGRIAADRVILAKERTRMTTVRDLFLEALSMKAKDVPWPKIHEHLINRGHDLGHAQIDEVINGDKYELTFATGDKISFDGTDYHFVRA